ncbi:MAG: YgjV family protein [Clostridia bacterium]|nr:YgjV family protein [Clostridia bacterium]
MNLLSIITSFIAEKKNAPFIKKHLPLIIVLTNLSMIAAGLMVYRNIFSLFSIVGVVLQTSAFFLTREKNIRFLSICGCPLWLTYNFVNHAFVSAGCDAVTMCSIALAIYRYDIKKKK